jgi:glycosyltransferase involved in cell wall biosynthesis
VIPVFNSEPIIETTVQRTVDFFEGKQLDYEIVLVNDGSSDGSWEKIKDIAHYRSTVKAINLLKNYGQHNANLCGFRSAVGDWVITMDDDLQNPPEEIEKLIEKAEEGYELIIGQFRQKKHAMYRRLGSRLINKINKSIFATPDGIVLSNFRLISRQVIDRICAYQTGHPYIPGLTIMFAHSVANVEVEHHSRSHAESNYNFSRILKLVATILFNYSSYPLRLMSYIGIIVAVLSLLIGGFYIAKGILFGASAPGWLTIVVLISIFSAIIMAMLGMIGEYLVRLINQTSNAQSYVIKEVVKENES